MNSSRGDARSASQLILVAAEVTKLIWISDFQSEPPYVGSYESDGGVEI